jgi:hypothetical protein
MILYFAYGSNTNLKRLRDYLAQRGCDPRGIRSPRRAFLDDYRIRTNYLMGGMTGAANIEPAQGKRVEGLLMDITAEVHHLLRRKEGWFSHRYREASIFVHLPRSRGLIMATTYVVSPQYQLKLDMPVHPKYRSTILQGAQRARFSQKYQRFLSRLLKTA